MNCAYQVKDTGGAGLLAGLLSEEQETLPSVGCPSSVVVGEFWLLPAKVA
jgi:hypothetical protein